ncbi:fibronectin type III domain-containing protein [Dysgonomonas sp. 520]|uniref:fibronectin type III domain-containing protein n=1 Tax=Dysgonomonas sp. 520 TaxID=2302931 RepID=UPI0013D28318|nr:fibronectin type III domain-containing protein [Dysgonomonas sp. 520]NDW11240.1 hypothetical protein [Dysgonomonas sp. 520]
MQKNKISYIKQLLLLVVSLTGLLSGKVQAQSTYPVQANVYVAKPYSSYLSDYYSSSKERLVVTLLNRDQQKPTLDVRLRVSVTAANGLKIQSKEEINYPTITLDAGIPFRLTQEDLAPYLLPRNINTQGSFNQGKLPEGMIEFTFQVVEKYTGKILSAPATAPIWLTYQKPPVLRLPSNNEHIAFKDPLNLKFQWEPLHKNLSQVEYLFELKELPNNGAAPQSAFLYAPLIYQEQLVYSYLMYNVMMPPLDPDKRYAWRVRAIAKDGVDELNMFVNEGYSEVYCFNTTIGCDAPTNCTATLKDRNLTLSWTAPQKANEYVVQYRLKYGTDATWVENNTYETQQTLYGLQRGETYEYRVGSICTMGQPVFSETGEIALPAVNEERFARCGIMGDFSLDNKEPIENLKTGDVVMLNDYPMTLTRVSGSNGSFSGEGWVPVNWLLETKWQVEFDNIQVNTDKRMIGGSVRAKYDETESQIANIDEITEGGHENTREGIIMPNIQLDVTIPENPVFDYNPESGEVTVFTTDGQKVSSFTPPTNDGKTAFPITIKDKDGNIYRVDAETDEQGNIFLAKEESNETSQSRIMDEIIVPIKDLPSHIDYYFTFENDSIALHNQKLNLAKNKSEKHIKLHKRDSSSINFDSIYIVVNSDTLRNTDLVKTNLLNNLFIQVKDIGRKDTLAYFDIQIHNSPHVEFKTLSTYNGEFGFDDGFDFASTSLPKINAIYDTIRNSDGALLYNPFITMNPNQTISIQADIIDKMPSYNYFIESSSLNISCIYDTTTSIANITSINSYNNFGTPDYISFYRKEKNNLEEKILIGRCEIVTMNKQPTINVQIMYYKTDTLPMSNTVNPIDLENKMNNNSLNQSFKIFNVNPSIYTFVDTVATAAHLSTSESAYRRALRGLMVHKSFNPTLHNPNTFYVIMTDLIFTDTATGGYKGGGVLNNSPYAAMWLIPGVTRNDMLEYIIHECGHTLQLKDTFNDIILGNPAQGFSRHNYMDYISTPRKMFFKSQIQIIYNQTPNP